MAKSADREGVVVRWSRPRSSSTCAVRNPSPKSGWRAALLSSQSSPGRGPPRWSAGVPCARRDERGRAHRV